MRVAVLSGYASKVANVAIPKGSKVLTCGHFPVRHILSDPKGERNKALLCDACFTRYLQEGELNIVGDQYLVDEDILEIAPEKWS